MRCQSTAPPPDTVAVSAALLTSDATTSKLWMLAGVTDAVVVVPTPAPEPLMVEPTPVTVIGYEASGTDAVRLPAVIVNVSPATTAFAVVLPDQPNVPVVTVVHRVCLL